jgi:hypothetical protein
MSLGERPQGDEVVEALDAMKIHQITSAAVSTNPTIPRIRPAIARHPPLTVPPLAAIRWREMKPMIAAAGPRMSPRQAQKQTTARIPVMSAPIASPSVRGAAYPAAAGA